jgi:anhydro-N-acetylmuramic acid kinase
VVINIGGISNITVLPEAADQPLSGFDTGPGNGLLDAWCEQHTGQPFDRAGQWAAAGTISTELLESMLGDPYLSRLPPKSTGREVFNLNWLETHRPGRYAPVDVQRTLIEFTARTLIDAIEQWATPSDLLIVCGGGRLNDFLMSRLQALTTTPVRASEAMNQDGDAIEAAAFAWLAAQRLAARSGNAEAVTGARGPRVLGAVYHGIAGDI